MKNIILVTPLKNEIDNIDRLFKEINSQTTRIKCWIIVENGSSDGSKEKLAEIQKPGTVDELLILNFSLPNDTYQLGIKYATVVSRGFAEVIQRPDFSSIDYIGILDADCFPESTYYEKLIEHMESDVKIGISSGLNYLLDGSHNGESVTWVTGNCRLWKVQCFLDAGYIIGPSADTLSACKAQLLGWKVVPSRVAKYYSRDMGVKVNFEYYGYANYFRGITPLYAFLKSINYLRLKKPKAALGFMIGYFSSYMRKADRVQDKSILDYHRAYLLKKIKYIPSYFKKRNY